MIRQKIQFPNEDGYKLSAYLELPVNDHPHNYAVFAHCFTCNKNFKSIRNIVKGLTASGFGVLSLDFTGLGESEGDFADSGFSSNISDIEAAAGYLNENHHAPALLVGHSLGGAACLLAAARINSVKSVATIAAPSDPAHVAHLFKNKKEEIKENGFADVDISGRTFRIKKQFIDDLENTSMEDVLKKIKKAMLIMHSPQDKIVDIDHAARIYQLAHHSKSFISLDGADHLLSRQDDSIYAGEVIGTWARRYVDIPDKPAIDTDNQTIVKLGDTQEKFTTHIKAGNHELIADEPKKSGGNDFGPNPYDLLTAALGACKAMTMRMYANHKNWDLQGVTLYLNHSKKYDEDCKDCDNQNTKIDHINVKIELEGNLDEKQRVRLLEISNRCPVHKTLKNPVKIELEKE